MQLAMVAEFEVSARDLDAFIGAARRDLLAVRKNEPGCLRFDVIVFDEGEGRGAFVEVCTDPDAAQAHMEFSHFKGFFNAIKGIDVQWKLHPGKAIE